LPVTYTSNSAAVCTVSGASVTPVSTGVCSITADQSGNAAFSPAPSVTRTFQVTLASQSITFAAIPAHTVGDSFALAATATSGLAVSFASQTPGVCTVAGATATMVAAGSCTIQATQAGNSVYAPAPPVAQSFPVASLANFTITPIPPQENAFRGVLAGFVLKITAVNGFQGNVTLSCSGGPDGAKCANFPMTVRLNRTAFALSGMWFPPNTPAGTYTVTFTGVSGASTATATAQFTVK
jgi:hypothetical protein